MAKEVKIVCQECRMVFGKRHKMDCTQPGKWVEAGTNKPYKVSLNLFGME